MPPLLGQIGISDAANPVLAVFTPEDGKLKDPYSLEFQIFRAESVTEQLTPVQVFPATAGARQAVNLADSPAGERIGVGAYFAKWNGGTQYTGTFGAGRHLVRWLYKFTATGPEKFVEHEFEMLAGATVSLALPFLSYAMIRDLREEGMAATDIPDARAIKLLRNAAFDIETATGRFFNTRRAVHKIDGTNSRELLLGDVLIALEQAEIVNTTLLGATSGIVDPEDLFIYSRHLWQSLLDPDDRENPKISFIKRTDLGGVTDPAAADLLFRDRLIFPSGAQNILLTGIWGYTEKNLFTVNDQVGRTPDRIRDVCMKIAFREAPKIGDTDARAELRRGPITSERTRTQAISYAVSDSTVASRAAGIFGDQEIDTILAQFARPIAIGAA